MDKLPKTSASSIVARLIKTILIITILAGCNPDVEDIIQETEFNKDLGTMEFNFALPRLGVPPWGVHRFDLSIAYSADSLYKELFFKMANVSDFQQGYLFHLPEGSYYWRAGITCSCAGDTCLWGGFPGGQWGKRFTFDQVQIIKGETTKVKPKFDR